MTGMFRGIGGSIANRGLSLVGAAMLLCATSAWGANTNQIVSVKVEEGAAAPTLLIQTREPIGYRYTVYDSFDPVRVVIDFPEMALTGLPGEIKAGQAPLQQVRIAKYDMASGSLARIEVVLSAAADYQVAMDGTNFRLVFPGMAKTAAAMPETAKTAVVQAPATTPAMADAVNVAGSEKIVAQPATVVKDVAVSAGQVVFATDGEINRLEHFVLANPPRLVVDLYGVKPAFKSRTFAAADGMKQLRIGAYADKVRGVFDPAGQMLPAYNVVKQADGVVVAWGKGGSPAPVVVAAPAKAPVAEPVAIAVVEPAATPAPVPRKKATVSGRQVSIDTFDFNNSDGRSVVILGLSAPASITAPKLEGNLLRFEIKNATISRTLRRTIDASAFPSAVSTVTPYLITDQGKQGVRFAVELKGPVAYRIEDEGEVVKLVIDDESFAQPLPPAVTTQEVVVKRAETMVTETPDMEELAPGRLPVATTQKPVYTGEKITLVFDNADVRSVIQLIGDVSGLNMLASNDVKGEITLRLIDVPWDQALDLVLQTADLGKIQDGNVVRIMPAKKLREIELAGMQAAKENTDQGMLETKVFEISYASLDDIVTNLNPIKSARGTIVKDSRSKQVIVKDVATVLDEMVQMIKTIDRPDKQVLIEARIVEVNSNFARDLGVRWGFSYKDTPNGDDLENAAIGLGGSFLLTPPIPGSPGTSAGGSVGLLFGLLDGSANLAVRLSALESEGQGKIISTPRITTLNGKAASIEQGTEVPYTAVGQNGQADTKFKTATLKLDVTPEINPDGTIILTVDATNDQVGDVVPQASGGSAVTINTRKAKTSVIVRDGSTTVIGGIFVEEERDNESGVPFLKDIPFFGYLFKSKSTSSSRKEILIFITPRIVEA